MGNSIFDDIIELPNEEIQLKANSLIGFEKRFERIHGNLSLLIDTSQLKTWEEKHHPKGLPIVSHIMERYPLVIFEGDVGTGKTVTAEGIADKMLRELGKQGFFIRLSTRVRGEGLHGEMGNLVNDAFDRLKKEAGKRRIAFLLIDEADAIATKRGTEQMHQEEKAGVNTLIQKIDEIRELKGRAIVIMSTNRLHFLDEAIVRRAALVVKFNRPNFDERLELFSKDLGDINFKKNQLKELAKYTGPEENDGIGFSYSDIRLKLFPEAIAKAFPHKPLSYEILLATIKELQPSPEIK